MAERREIDAGNMRSEDLFLAWVLQLPHTADIAEQARIEIARLDAAKRDCEASMRLRDMLLQASSVPFAMPRGRNRSRH
jgi:hypothetical protein